MLGIIARVVAALITGVGLGLASAWIATSPGVAHYPIRNGAWRASANMGNAGDDPYVRAYNARIAWFSNDPDANIYFESTADSAGRPLDIHCTYLISGAPLPARWWSITAYSDFHWMPNDANRFSFTSTQLHPGADGLWRFTASPHPQQGEWLPFSGAGRLTFVLRLYDLESALTPEQIRTPAIERRSCS